MIYSENSLREYRKGNYYIIIKATLDDFEAYIQEEKCGIIEMMFGIAKKDILYWEFIELVEKNLDDYIEYYEEEYLNDKLTMDN